MKFDISNVHPTHLAIFDAFEARIAALEAEVKRLGAKLAEGAKDGEEKVSEAAGVAADGLGNAIGEAEFDQ